MLRVWREQACMERIHGDKERAYALDLLEQLHLDPADVRSKGQFDDHSYHTEPNSRLDTAESASWTLFVPVGGLLVACSER